MLISPLNGDFFISEKKQMNHDLQITKFTNYLNSLREEAIKVNENDRVVDITSYCFNSLSNLFSKYKNGILQVPDCCYGYGNEDFRIMLTWDNQIHHLECEINQELVGDFTYRNKLTKEVWGQDSDLNNPQFPDTNLDEVLIDKLSHFTY